MPLSCFWVKYIVDCHLKTNMLLTFFAVNHSAMSLGVNASHETPDDAFCPATLIS